jgi:uncharacterized protein (TIGR02466 family)
LTRLARRCNLPRNNYPNPYYLARSSGNFWFSSATTQPPPVAQHSQPMFDTPDLIQIFPSFVWRACLTPEVYAPINKSILSSLNGIGAPLVHLRPGESWQSDHNLHRQEQFRSVTDWMKAGADNVLEYLKVIHTGAQLTGCWANVNAPGASHRLHSHRNNYLSGVYYVQVPDRADTINFFDPRAQAGVIRPPVSAFIPENTEQVVLKVKEGMIMIFPAWLQHSVDMNCSNQARISLSFNIMLTDFTESTARPHWKPGVRITK